MKVRTTIIFKLIVLQLILMVLLSSCHRKKTAETEGYDWIPTIGAPEEYPIIIIKGEFIAGKGFTVGLPICAFVHAGWGNSGCIIDIGSNKKPVPDSLSITWLSYAENKFYRGSFALPEQKISELFKKGFLDHNTNKQQNYDYLTLGMTPGGTVVLWLSGRSKQVEVGKFLAKEVQLTVHELGADYAHIFKPGFAKNAYERNVSKELREKAEKVGFKTDQVNKWLKRYNWRFTANLNAAKFYEIYCKYLNAEEEEVFDASLVNNSFEQRAVPKEIEVIWIDQKGRKMITDIVFDETEIQLAFALIPHDGKAELHFEVDPTEYTVAVTLKTEDKDIKIVKQKSKTQHDSE